MAKGLGFPALGHRKQIPPDENVRGSLFRRDIACYRKGDGTFAFGESRNLVGDPVRIVNDLGAGTKGRTRCCHLYDDLASRSAEGFRGRRYGIGTSLLENGTYGKVTAHDDGAGPLLALAGPGPARKDAVFVSNRREDYLLSLLVLRLTGETAVYVGRGGDDRTRAEAGFGNGESTELRCQRKGNCISNNRRIIDRSILRIIIQRRRRKSPVPLPYYLPDLRKP